MSLAGITLDKLLIIAILAAVLIGPERLPALAEKLGALVRVGGSVLVAHALMGGRVADPAQRSDEVADLRALLRELSTSDAVRTAVTPVGDGLLQIVRLPEPA